jgi:hypothetical protein
MNRQAFVSRAVGVGVATKVYCVRWLPKSGSPLNNPDDGRTITQKIRLGVRGKLGDAGLAKEKRSSALDRNEYART